MQGKVGLCVSMCCLDYMCATCYLCQCNQIIVLDDDEINNCIQMKKRKYKRGVKTHAGIQSIVIFIHIFHRPVYNCRLEFHLKNRPSCQLSVVNITTTRQSPHPSHNLQYHELFIKP